MSTTQQKDVGVSTRKKIKIETTYRYVPIIRGVLGIWRKVKVKEIGDRIELSLITPLEEFDDVFINGTKINLK